MCNVIDILIQKVYVCIKIKKGRERGRYELVWDSWDYSVGRV